MYFYEDEVYSIDKKNHVKFGLVLETEEFEEFQDKNLKNFLKVVWHDSGRDEIINTDKIGLADRTLMPGDVVRRMNINESNCKDLQRGYCREIHVKADLKIIGNSKYVIKDVSSERLTPLIKMPRDNAVCLDSWVGSTKNIDEKLILKSSCGSLLELRPDIEYCPLKDKNMKNRYGFFAGTLFYVGQTLVGNVNELDNAKWITTSPEMRTSRKHKNMDRKFVVQSVDIEGVFVHWQCKASCDENDDKDTGVPKSYVSGDDLKRLKRLNLFESCMLQINDKNYLKISESDTIVRKSQWKKEQSNKYRILSNKQQSKKNLISEKSQEEYCDNNSKVKVTTTDCEHTDAMKSECCDKNKLCPVAAAKMKIDVTQKKSPDSYSKSHNGGGDSDDWLTEDDEMVDSDFSDSATTASSCSSNPTPKGSPKKSPLLAHKIQKLKKRRQKSDSEQQMPKVNDEVVTEALVVYSWATVVWQDGTIEKDISSIELCPIHHLDDHEFFPADFVLAANDDSNMSYRDYGVIQRVDHLGRTALVKWFSTYTDVNNPTPLYKGESEVSVYDLKDHPDFQYRPGTIVIRVANFNGEDANCTAGQVVDNYAEGRVKVWWVDGHVSMSWPQDLFEVGQYDADNAFWGNTSDEDSWETEDETSELGGLPQTHLTANLERARVAMSRLEEMFVINPNLQSQEVMKKLLMVYKKCRYLDRLMNTSFFHESNFNGLLERVRKSGNQTTAERVQDQKNRLFNSDSNPDSEIPEAVKKTQKKANLLEITKSSSNSNEDNSFCSFESTKSLSSGSGSSNGNPGSSGSPTKNAGASPKNQLSVQQKNNISTSSDISSITDLDPESRISLSPTNRSKSNHSTPKQLSKANENESDSGILITLNSDKKESSFLINQQENECVCAKLCSLIKVQLVKALQEINNRYCPSDSFKEIVEFEVDSDKNNQEEQENEENTETLAQNLKLMKQHSIDESSSNQSSDLTIPSASTADNFQVQEEASNSHKYHLTVFHTTNAQNFFKAVQKEYRLLKNSLPTGVWVRAFEDRLDLLSVLIEGPKNTPYEDGLFAFDIQLGHDYPRTPPLCHYISYCSDRLNPNLYEDGKVCVSLLGTWSGKGTEVWTSSSNLLQVIVSIQGLILVDEPYFNEAGYEKQRGTQQGKENSRMYNEMVVLKLVQSMTKMLMSPPEIFRDQVLNHFKANGMKFYNRIKKWMDMSNEYNSSHNLNQLELSGYIDPANANIVHSESLQCLMQYAPGFPLFPASRGFCLTLAGLLENFLSKLQAIVDKNIDV